MCKDERDRLKAASAQNSYERDTQSINTGYDYAEEGDAVPNTESPPAILARHAQMHRDIGLKLREQAMQLLEQSMQHLAAAGDLDAARRRIVD